VSDPLRTQLRKYGTFHEEEQGAVDISELQEPERADQRVQADHPDTPETLEKWPGFEDDPDDQRVGLWTRFKRPLVGTALGLSVAVPVAIGLFLILSSSTTEPNIRAAGEDAPVPVPAEVSPPNEPPTEAAPQQVPQPTPPGQAEPLPEPEPQLLEPGTHASENFDLPFVWTVPSGWEAFSPAPNLYVAVNEEHAAVLSIFVPSDVQVGRYDPDSEEDRDLAVQFVERDPRFLVSAAQDLMIAGRAMTAVTVEPAEGVGPVEAFSVGEETLLIESKTRVLIFPWGNPDTQTIPPLALVTISSATGSEGYDDAIVAAAEIIEGLEFRQPESQQAPEPAPEQTPRPDARSDETPKRLTGTVDSESFDFPLTYTVPPDWSSFEFLGRVDMLGLVALEGVRFVIHAPDGVRDERGKRQPLPADLLAWLASKSAIEMIGQIEDITLNFKSGERAGTIATFKRVGHDPTILTTKWTSTDLLAGSESPEQAHIFLTTTPDDDPLLMAFITDRNLNDALSVTSKIIEGIDFTDDN
jgi:hypothetical protein